MQRKTTLGNRIAYLALISIEALLRLIPLTAVWNIGAFIGKLAYPIAGSRRDIVLRNLEIVHPDLNSQERDKLAKNVFRHSFANLLSSAKTGTMSVGQLKNHITIEGLDIIKNLPTDKGCIFMVFHMGNWEILTRIHKLISLGKPSGAIFQNLKNPLVNQHVLEGREKEGMHLFAKRKGLAEAAKFLKNGGFLGILSDQYAGKKGIKATLFNQETSISPLAASMAYKYQCPIVPVIVTTTRAGKWHIQYADPQYISTELNKNSITTTLVSTMEKIMRENSKDIFWLHNRWKQRRFTRAQNVQKHNTSAT